MVRKRVSADSASPPNCSHLDVAALAYKDMATFELGIVVELFGLPRPEFARWYRFKVCALEPGALGATGGLLITPPHGIEALSRAGTIVIPSWRTDELPPGEAPAHSAARTLPRRQNSVCLFRSICTSSDGAIGWTPRHHALALRCETGRNVPTDQN